MNDSSLELLGRGKRSWLTAGLLAGLVIAPFNAIAQDDDVDLEDLEAFEITGSLIPRTEGSSPTPVLTIDREDIERSGFQQVSDLIRNLPMNSGISEADATASFAADGAYVNLRGIGPNGTLVLLNGRRLAPYGAADFNGRAFVDLNSIPPSAIERVDVILVGASAIYGSDALAGAINIVTRQDFEGLEISVFHGNTSSSEDFSTTNVSATLGIGNERGSLMVVANYYSRNDLFLRQRDYSANGYAGEPFDLSSTLAADGFFDFRKLSEGQSRGGLFEGFQVSSAAYPGRFTGSVFDSTGANLAGTTYIGGYLFAGDGSDAQQAEWEYFNFNDEITAISAAERKGLIVVGDYDVTDTVEVFVQANYQSNFGSSTFAPAPSFGDFTIPASNPYNPTNPANGAFYQESIYTRVGADPSQTPDGVDLSVTFRPGDAGNRLFRTWSNFARFLTGAKIEVPEIDITFEPSYLYVESSLEDLTRNLLVADNVQAALERTETSATSADPSTWAMNPFVNGVNQFDNELIYNDFLKTDDTRLSRSSLSLWRLLATGEILELPAGSLGFAAGAEYRRESVADRPSLASQQGQLIGSGGTSSEGERDASSFYAELAVPVTKLIDVQLAARYEDISDAGDTGVRPQAGVVFRPIEGLSLRAAYADNFKAPSLAQSFAGVQRGFIAREDRIRFPITGDQFDGPDQQKETRTGGNPNLVSEESETFAVTVGYDVTSGPLEGLFVELSGWRIEASNLITTITENEILIAEAEAYNADPAGFLALSPQARLEQYNVLREPNENFQGQTIPGQIQYINSVYLNLDTYETQGLDLTLNYSFPTDSFGDFTFNTVWTYIDEVIQEDSDNLVGTFRRPEFRGNASVSWNRADWSASVIGYYVDGYEDTSAWSGGPDAGDMVEEYYTFDLRVSYSGFMGVTATVGIDNIFDEEPPLYRGDNSYYDPAFADPIGRFIWASLSREF